MKLKVGKKYMTRAGQKVAITNKDSDPDWPFTGIVNGMLKSWRENGRYLSTKDHRHDLIEEVNTDENERTT